MLKNDGLSGAMAARRASSELRHVAENDRAFAVAARRNRKLAAWVSGLLGHGDRRAETYVQEVIDSDLQAPGHDDVVAKLVGDFETVGLGVSEAEIRSKLAEFEAEARIEMDAP